MKLIVGENTLIDVSEAKIQSLYDKVEVIVERYFDENASQVEIPKWMIQDLRRAYLHILRGKK